MDDIADITNEPDNSLIISIAHLIIHQKITQSRFPWSVDKIQAIHQGRQSNWKIESSEVPTLYNKLTSVYMITNGELWLFSHPEINGHEMSLTEGPADDMICVTPCVALIICKI